MTGLRAATRTILVCVDGLASYVTAFPGVFRQPIRTGRRGRPRLVLPAGFQLAQVVKHAAKRHVVGVTRRVIHDTLAGIEAVLTATATGTVITPPPSSASPPPSARASHHSPAVAERSRAPGTCQ